MAESKLVTPPVVEFKFNEQAVKEHVKKVEDGVNATAGKKNYNPFLWVKEVVQPLVDKFIKGDRSKDLQDSILALPTTPPPIIQEQAKPAEPVLNQVSGTPEDGVKANVLKPVGLKI